MIYIANCTKQTFRFCFRQPESGRILILDIASGKQEMFGQSMDASHNAIAVNMLESFGARNHKQMSTDIKDFDGILYSLDKPILADDIEAAHEVLVDKQEKRSATEATRSALAFDAAGKKNGKRMAKVSAVEVEQVIPARERPTGKEVNFGVSVETDGSNRVALPV